MQWQRVVTRILVFVVGVGGVAVAVFVGLPWLESSDHAPGGPQSGDAIVEEVPATCGKPETEGPPETDDRASNTPGVTTIPIPLVATAGESPARVGMTAVIIGGPLDAAATPSIGLPEAMPPKGATVTASEASAKEGEQDADTGDDPVTASPGFEEVRAVEASVSAELPRGVWIEAENGAAAALAGEPDKETRPQTRKDFPPRAAAREPSGAAMPRLEFEMPDDFRIVESSLRTGDTPASGEAVAATAERRPEFSTRRLIRSESSPPAEDLPRTAGSVEAALYDTGRSDPVQVPGTLRGVMGYRLPLVSRQELPDQVVSGVLIPAHTTYVILQPGYWELVGLSPGDAEALRATVEKAKADQQAMRSEPNARGWNPFWLFRRKQTPAGGN